uniref:Uncharacterized protein n=1 Tax=Plectus sambesii TaxID=2011161 RepID=A0A914VPY7_9BILA
MGLYTVMLSVAFLSGVLSSLNYDEPEDELIASDDQSVASFFDYWIPRMRMRGRRSVDAKPSHLHHGTAKSAKRIWNSNQKDVMSFLDAYKQDGFFLDCVQRSRGIDLMSVKFFANWESDDEEALAWMGKLGFRFRRLDPFMNDYAHPRYEMMNNEWNLNNLGKRFQVPTNDGSNNMK